MLTTTRTHRLASLMALTAALAGCGGATDKDNNTTAPPPPASAPVTLHFVQPTENVLEPGASEPLAADVTVNGGAAPNGTVVTFTVNPSAAATFSPVAPTTVASVASTTLTVSSLPPSATFQVSATATSSANTAGDSLTYYVRPTHKNLQVLVPAYFSASGTSSPWATLTSGAASYPDVQITAVASASDGVLTADSEVDDDLLTAIKDFKAVAGTTNKVVAYVATSGSGGSRSVADVKATIDNYIRLYPDQLDGFFLDGMATDSARLAYFQDVYNYAKARASGMSKGATPPNAPTVIGDSKMLCSALGRSRNTSGTAATPRPMPREIATISTLRRCSPASARILIPATATVPNMIRVAPPSTGLGISCSTAPTTGNRPSSTRIAAM